MEAVDIHDAQVSCGMSFCSKTEEHSAGHGIHIYSGEAVFSGSLSDRFIDLVGKNCLRERKLEFYARKLNVSVKYLSNVVTKSTGRKASMWIADQVISEAKRRLAGTDAPIQTIAEELGFETFTEFCRFFKARVGMPPGKYRKHVMSEMEGQSHD